ncbi:hypothetical protein [Dyadobacter alkalitolerans]|uniref:hypothetical protein n=1 Tax=Dyadobacter alkalitolerans TaxID=492736 RepID=UPI000409C890|nr:hypothetical protein [Dyadobacter alkalitolerans]
MLAPVMDGFAASVTVGKQPACLTKAYTFGKAVVAKSNGTFDTMEVTGKTNVVSAELQ